MLSTALNLNSFRGKVGYEKLFTVVQFCPDCIRIFKKLFGFVMLKFATAQTFNPLECEVDSVG